MAKIKTLFPPLVSSSLPAFDKSESLKYYFKPSIANTMNQVQSLQVSIVRLDTNRNELDQNSYPYGLMFLPKSAATLDEKTGYYYITIDKSIFKKSDIPYKIQIRLSEVALPSSTTDPSMGDWIKNNLDKFSEWSIVTVVMPITPPDFGFLNLDETVDNKLNSSSYDFVGYYEAKDPNKQEALTFYKFSIYTYTDFNDTKTWELYSTTGDRTIGIYEKPNLSHVFSKDLMQGAKYVATMSIRTKNMYAKTKTYRVTSAYPVLEMFNSLSTEVNEDKGSIVVTVNAKQMIMKKKPNTEVTYIKEEPGHESQPYLRATHAVVKGEIYENERFFMINQDAKYIIQTKIRDMKVYETLAEGYQNPTLEVKYNAAGYDSFEYYTKLKLFAFKINLAYPTSSNLNPSEQWEYRFILRKEVVTRANMNERVLFSQNKIFRPGKVINPKQEYYFFIKEEQGLIDFEVKETYLAR